MGGQACVLYGASEFSRDTDVALLASRENLSLLRAALHSLHAKRIALPPFEYDYLLRGHAIHFRCYHPDASGMRLDVMSTMRGVDTFNKLWERRTRFALNERDSYGLLSLPDLIRAKKTQRDKDWPMIRRLIEADYVSQKNPSRETINLWLLESRTPEMLIAIAKDFRDDAVSIKPRRLAVSSALAGDEVAVQRELEQEEKAERDADRLYWEPLKKELEALRHGGPATEEDVT
jgi:hypothetical protein